MKLTDIIGSTFRFEEIRSGLQSRTYSTGEQSFASFNLIGIAQRGHIFLYFDDKEIEISELDHFKEKKIIRMHFLFFKKNNLEFQNS